MQRSKGEGRVFEGWGLGVKRAREELEAVGGILEYRADRTGAAIVMISASPSPLSTPKTSDGGKPPVA